MDYIHTYKSSKIFKWEQVNALLIFVLALIVLCGLLEIHIKQCTGYQVMTLLKFRTPSNNGSTSVKVNFINRT